MLVLSRPPTPSVDDDDVTSLPLKNSDALKSLPHLSFGLRRRARQTGDTRSGTSFTLPVSAVWRFRVPAEPGQAPGLHGADPRRREGSFQGPEDPQRHAKVRPHLPRVARGSDRRQEQGQGAFGGAAAALTLKSPLVVICLCFKSAAIFCPDLQDAGGQSGPGHPLRRAGRGHQRRDGSGEPSQAGSQVAAAGGERSEAPFVTFSSKKKSEKSTC